MSHFSKALPISLLAAGLLVTACQESTSSHVDPNPKSPPPTIKVTGPDGGHEMDSAAFQQMLQQPGIPDSLPPQRPKAKRNP